VALDLDAVLGKVKRQTSEPKKRKKKPKLPIPSGRGQDLPELLDEVRSQARGRLRSLLTWNVRKKQPDWTLGIYAGWLDFVPYVGTGRVFIAGLMMPVVTDLLKRGHRPSVLAMMSRQRGIDLVESEDLRHLFPSTAHLLDGKVAAVDDETGYVRVQSLGGTNITYVDAVDLAMAWLGTPPPHRLMFTAAGADMAVLYDGRGHASLVTAAV